MTSPDTDLVCALALLYGGMIVTAIVADAQDALWRWRQRRTSRVDGE